MKKSVLIAISILYSFGIFAQVRSVSVEEFEEQLVLTNGRQLIDCRSPQEFERSRIWYAENINIRDPEFERKISRFSKSEPILVYCLHGIRSKLAMGVLQEAGFETVFELDKGIDAWTKAGRAVKFPDESGFCESIRVDRLRDLIPNINTFVGRIDEDLPYETKLNLLVGWFLSYDCITEARIDCMHCVLTGPDCINNSRIAFSFIENGRTVNKIMIVQGDHPYYMSFTSD